jgi:hypothetical protein
MVHAAESAAMHADVVGHTILHEVAGGIPAAALDTAAESLLTRLAALPTY